MDDVKSSLIARMKNGFKSYIMAGLALVLVLSNMVAPAQAASPVVNETYTSNWKANHLHLPDGSNGDGTFFWVDGELAWCIEPGKSAHVGTNESVTFESLGYNDATRKTITYIAYFGYYLQPSEVNYFLTQNLIWATLRPDLANQNYYYNSAYPTVASQQAWRNAVMAQVNAMETTPKFNISTITLDVGESITLTDSNNILSNYIVNGKSDGLNVSINGNQLTITATASADENSYINLIRSIKILQEGIPFAAKVTANDTQAVSPLNTIKSSDPARAILNITVNKYGNLNIAKQDNNGNYVPNTAFKISYNADMSSPIGTYTTGADGTVTINELLPQTVYVQEVSVPDHLILDNTIRSVTIVPNETVYFSATNDWKQGKIQVIKKDTETGETVKKAGTQFDILNANNQIVATITTNSEGVAVSDWLDYGTYKVKEKTAPNGYTVNVTESNPVAVIENNQTYTVDISNTRVKGSITLQKEFAQTETGLTGNSILEGVTYELHAHENILNPADGSILYAKDSVIPNTLKLTDSDGKITWTDLYLGSYDVHEVSSNGTVVVNTVDVTANLDYADQNTSNVSVSVTHQDKPNEQAYSLIKIGTNGSTGEVPVLEGAEFTAKLKSDVDVLGWENAPTYDVSVTDSKGYFVSQKLPYGTYVIRETKKPDEHEAVEDFIITITEDSNEPQVWRIMNDAPFEGVLKLVKKDAETGKTVLLSNTTFKIKNLDTGEYLSQFVWFPLPHIVDSWSTTDQGIVYLNNVVMYGNYQLEEITAPDGYVLNDEPVKFSVSENGVYETGEDGVTPVITVEMEDVSVKGQISVEKIGEQVVGVQKDEAGNIQFVYEKKSVDGATFIVEAAEDILSADHQGDVIYAAGTKVAELTTINGKATTENLPLGKYKVIEQVAGDTFVLNSEVKTVELTYKDQETAVVNERVEFENQRQKVILDLVKYDSETSVALKEAVFGLYAKEDVLGYDGSVLVKAGTLVERVVSDEKGKLNFKADLPINQHFEIKELSAPIGYATTAEVIDVDTTYQGQESPTISYLKEIKNEITKVEISKKDATTDQELAGAHLTLKEKDGSVFETWISGNEPHIVKGLEPNKTYELIETSSPYGFALSQKIEFTVQDSGEIQKVEMKDDLVVGYLKWQKTGEAFNHTITGQNEFGTTQTPLWESQNLLGAKITIYAAEDITLGNGITYWHKDEAIQTLESDWESVSSTPLLVGKYYYVESSDLHGYVTDTQKHYFEIEDNQPTQIQVIESTLKNKRPNVKVQFTKYMEMLEDHEETDAWSDVVFGIYARDDIYNYMGEVAIPAGQLINTSGIDSSGQLEHFPDLPNGMYYLKELQTNHMYNLDPSEYDFEIAWHGGDVSEYQITIGNDEGITNELQRGSIYLQKTDIDTKEKLANVRFTIATDQAFEHIVQTGLTDQQGYLEFKELELGTYFIKEDPVDGYVTNEHIYEVEVENDGDQLGIQVENKPVKMLFSKIDITSEKELPGAKMQVTDKESGEVIDEWISGNEPHEIKYLVQGKEYVLTELSAPRGYEIAESITFKAEDGGTITMKDQQTPDLPNTSDSAHLMFYFGGILVSAGFILVIICYKKRKDHE